jgi:metallo-beta-lactamase class B
MPTLLLLFAALLAQSDPRDRSWNQPVEPFTIAGNLHYVGANEITSFLVTTPAGHIVLDAGFAETAPMILANIRKLGFKPEDVKFLLNSQAHYDHAAGFAELKRATGATLAVMVGDAELMARGGVKDFAFGDKYPYPPIKPDRILHDGDTIELGGTTMKAVLTPGHTRGCTTWTMKAGGKDVVFVCSPTAPGYDLSDPKLVAQFRKSFAIWEALPCDIFLASHGSFFDLKAKAVTKNFVDPDGYKRFIREARAAFEEQVKQH